MSQQNSVARGHKFADPSPAQEVTGSYEPVTRHDVTTKCTNVQRLALDRVYTWLFEPLPEEMERERAA